jgi:uncharacterized protein (TIGR03435 family)
MIQGVWQLGLRFTVLLAVAEVLVLTTPSVGAAQAALGGTVSGLAISAASQAAQAKLPEWDVVSVRPVEVQKCMQGSGWRPTADGLNFFCVSPLVVIEEAYLIREPSRILGAPDWMKSSTFYDIVAKVAGEDVAAYGKLSHDDRSRMMQSLLAERFHLKAHMEQREIPIYQMVVAKGGSKLKSATPDEAGMASVIGHGGKIKSVDMPLTSLPTFLNAEVGRPVVDKTALTGKYDFTLEYVPAAKAATDESGGPSIFTALEEQLGLKLEPVKGPMNVLVIDSIEQPTAN